MHIKNHTGTSLAGLLLLFLGMTISTAASAVAIVNSGFNDQSGWTTGNDATLDHPGGVANWTWNTPLVNTLIVTATETILPLEGDGLGLTYAGSDEFSQVVNILSAGDYRFSVFANAATGRSFTTLVDGEFEFMAGAARSSTNTVVTTDGWEEFTWTTTLSAGLLSIGLTNTLTGPYVIAYDQFSLEKVGGPAVIPVPAAVWLFGTAIIGLIGFRKKKAA